MVAAGQLCDAEAMLVQSSVCCGKRIPHDVGVAVEVDIFFCQVQLCLMLLVIREVAILQYKPRDGTGRDGIVSFSLYNQWLTCTQAKYFELNPV
jgi:hypothetical protein